MRVYQIQPRDVLFFRDGRPMETGVGSGGHGANWPLPSIFFDAVHAALHRAFPDRQAWENVPGKSQGARMDNPGRKQRHGSLSTAGLFPLKSHEQRMEWYFPCPADLMDETGRTLCPMQENLGRQDLPSPLKYPVANSGEPSKDKALPWRSRESINAYLNGKTDGTALTSKDIYHGEWSTGIGMDPETQTQDGKRIYSAEYLRLEANISMGALASMPLKEHPDMEAMDELIGDGSILVMGGQQRTCGVRKLPDTQLEQYLPVGPAVQGERIKWTLLSPAIFPRMEAKPELQIKAHPGGWLPNWIDAETGRVKLLHGGVGRKKAFRTGQPTGAELDVNLVAAVIPKPITINGWSAFLPSGEKGGVDSTLLAVPAGSVYYFEGPDAAKLADPLNWHGPLRSNITKIVNRRSTLLGEKGFGLGVCGTWEFFK